MARELSELNLLDDFLFTNLVSYPELGEQFVRKLLTIIFGREFGHLEIVTQKVYYGVDPKKHGARLDVYLEEPVADGTAPGGALVYDIEPDQNDKEWQIAVLPRRVRFYHAKIDAKSLRSGTDYRELKNVIVLMIVNYDPFGWDRVMYTIERYCKELPEMAYEDGARTIFLYTKGKKGECREELRQLLRYLEDSRAANAVNEDLREINRMVDIVRQDGEVSVEFMKYEEWVSFLKQEGREEGRKAERANTERERRRAEEECRRAEKECRRAEKEYQRANAAEERVKILEEELCRLKAGRQEK